MNPSWEWKPYWTKDYISPRNDEIPAPEAYDAYLRNVFRLVMIEIVRGRHAFHPEVFSNKRALAFPDQEEVVVWLDGKSTTSEVVELFDDDGVAWEHDATSTFAAKDPRLSTLFGWIENGVFEALNNRCAQSIALTFTDATGPDLLEAWIFELTFSDDASLPPMLSLHYQTESLSIRPAAGSGSLLFSGKMAGALRASANHMIESVRAHLQSLPPLPDAYKLEILIQSREGTQVEAMPSAFRFQAADHLIDVFDAFDTTPVADLAGKVALGRVEGSAVVFSPSIVPSGSSLTDHITDHLTDSDVKIDDTEEPPKKRAKVVYTSADAASGEGAILAGRSYHGETVEWTLKFKREHKWPKEKGEELRERAALWIELRPYVKERLLDPKMVGEQMKGSNDLEL